MYIRLLISIRLQFDYSKCKHLNKIRRHSSSTECLLFIVNATLCNIPAIICQCVSCQVLTWQSSGWNHVRQYMLLAYNYDRMTDNQQSHQIWPRDRFRHLLWYILFAGDQYSIPESPWVSLTEGNACQIIILWKIKKFLNYFSLWGYPVV